ncbi:MAG: cation:proton antiporter, partial [Actinomycetota bacterium]
MLALAAILVAAKLLGELAERIGQPAVLGELVAGVLLGGSVFGVVPTEGVGAELIHVLAELGVILLLFEIGLETDLREMFRVGPASLAVATVGVVLPFALGYLYWAYV